MGELSSGFSASDRNCEHPRPPKVTYGSSSASALGTESTGLDRSTDGRLRQLGTSVDAPGPRLTEPGPSTDGRVRQRKKVGQHTRRSVNRLGSVD